MVMKKLSETDKKPTRFVMKEICPRCLYYREAVIGKTGLIKAFRLPRALKDRCLPRCPFCKAGIHQISLIPLGQDGLPMQASPLHFPIQIMRRLYENHKN
jgi:hypothetical protein